MESTSLSSPSIARSGGRRPRPQPPVLSRAATTETAPSPLSLSCSSEKERQTLPCTPPSGKLSNVNCVEHCHGFPASAAVGSNLPLHPC